LRRFVAPPPSGEFHPTRPPTFSVIIAAYQAAHVIGDAIESALSQTAPPYEVIVCDDGSTDDIESALAAYRDQITFLRKENGGEASAKNAGVCAATGAFVVLLDADDVFLPQRLEALGELAAARPDLDILTTDASIELDGRELRRCYGGNHIFIVDDQRRGILERNFIFTAAAVRRSRLRACGGFDEAIRQTTDWDCWIRLILDGSRAGLVDEPLARYRLFRGSLSSQREAHLEGRLMTLAKAALRSDLKPTERETLNRTITSSRRALRLARARAAILEKRPDARARTFEVVVGSGFSAKTRAKALAALLAPNHARGRLVMRPRETTAGILLPPAQEEF
jgi:glycosyltransferase involved in cell wall biosynthesis